MIPRLPYLWRTLQTLSPSRLVENIRSLRDQVNSRVAHRYHLHTATMEWANSTASATPTFLEYRFTLPYDTEILGYDISGVSSGNINSITVTGTSGNTTETPDSPTLSIFATNRTPYSAAAGTNLSFTLAATYAGLQTGKFFLTLHLRTDRKSLAPSLAPWELDESLLPRAGAASSNVNLSNELDYGLAALADLQSGVPTIQILPFLNVPAAGGLTAGRGVFRVPATGRTLRRVQLGVYSVNTSTWRIAPTNLASAAATISVVGAGASTLALSALTSYNIAQVAGDLANTADDSLFTFSRSAGANAAPHIYAVLHWS